MLRIIWWISKLALRLLAVAAGLAGWTRADVFGGVLSMIPVLYNPWISAALVIMGTVGITWDLARAWYGRVPHEIKPDWNHVKLIRYLRFGHALSSMPIRKIDHFMPVVDEIEDRLSLGHLRSWGRRSDGGVLEEIDKTYWQRNSFEPLEIYQHSDGSAVTKMQAYKGNRSAFFQVLVSSQQVRDLWRPADPLTHLALRYSRNLGFDNPAWFRILLDLRRRLKRQIGSNNP